MSLQDDLEAALARASEIVRREFADKHRDEILDLDNATPVPPRKFDQVMSVRMDAELARRLREAADRDGETVADVLRRAAERATSPIGFQCEHSTMTAGGFLMRLVSVTGSCGCQMVPVYP